MPESRIEATDRLRREGRWGSASAFREQKRREFRTTGIKRGDANDAAWGAMLAEFSPETAKPTGEAPVNDPKRGHARPPRRRSPQFDVCDEITWVYNHLGADDVDLDACPSPGAYSLWHWARCNTVRFYNLLWPKAEAARVMQFKPVDDSVFVLAVFKFDEKRAVVMAQMAADLEKVTQELAARAMWILMVDRPALAEELTRSFGAMLHRLSVERMSTALVSPTNV